MTATPPWHPRYAMDQLTDLPANQHVLQSFKQEHDDSKQQTPEGRRESSLNASFTYGRLLTALR